jgi:hypothetical protein
MKNVIILLVAWGILSGCATIQGIVATPTVDPCGPEAIEEYLDRLIAVQNEFVDNTELAFSTSRINLSGPVGKLQEVKREAQDIEYPDCAAVAHKKLIDYMDATIDAFFSFMTDKSDVKVEADFLKASTARE